MLIAFLFVVAAAHGDERSFDDSGAPVLVARRKASGKLPAGKACEELERGFFASRQGEVLSSLESAWKPWNAVDRDPIEECDSLPCAIKVDAAEAAEIAAKPEDRRFVTYLALVKKRSEQYRKEGKPRDYEFPAAKFGAIAEPFAAFVKKLGAGAPPSTVGPLQARKLVSGDSSGPGSSKVRIVRQVIERRELKQAGRSEIWIRATYTDHFFDAWGEWASFHCDAVNGWKVDAAILTDVDLLKNDDFFSKLGRGKMKSTSEEVMQNELSLWISQLAFK